MEKRFCLALLSLLIAGCDSPISSESIVSSESESSTIDYGSWEQSVYEAISTVMDPSFIPKIEAEACNAVVGEENGVSYVDINFAGGFNTETIESEYENILKENGFSITDNNGLPYAFKEYSLTEDGIIQYEVTNNGLFSLVCYKIEQRITEWPEYYIQNICDSSIPKFETATYECSISYNKAGYNGYYLTMNCNKAGAYSEVDYTALLQENGYKVVDNAGLKYANNTEKEIEIIYYYLDDTDDLFMLVHSTSNWPVSDVNFFLGESLPRFKEVPVAEYTYLNSSSDGSEILAIYCDGASEGAKDVYKEQLINAGWVFNEEDTENGYIFTKTIEEKEHMVQLVYGYIEQAGIYSLVIGIY